MTTVAARIPALLLCGAGAADRFACEAAAGSAAVDRLPAMLAMRAAVDRLPALPATMGTAADRLASREETAETAVDRLAAGAAVGSKAVDRIGADAAVGANAVDRLKSRIRCETEVYGAEPKGPAQKTYTFGGRVYTQPGKWRRP